MRVSADGASLRLSDAARRILVLGLCADLIKAGALRAEPVELARWAAVQRCGVTAGVLLELAGARPAARPH
jgi:hypothetical protein